MKNEIEPSPPVIKSDTNQPSSFFFFLNNILLGNGLFL